MEVSPQYSEGEGTPTLSIPGPVFYKNNSEGEDDLIVSGAITPLTAQVEVLEPQTGARGVFTALLGSGCTCCTVSLQTVEKLGLRFKRLRQSMKFEQVDGLLTGGGGGAHNLSNQASEHKGRKP